MKREHLLTLIDVVSETAALLEALPVQETDALTDSVHRCSCYLRKAESALMLTAASALLAETPAAVPSVHRGRGE